MERVFEMASTRKLAMVSCVVTKKFRPRPGSKRGSDGVTFKRLPERKPQLQHEPGALCELTGLQAVRRLPARLLVT